MKCRHCQAQLQHVFIDLGFAPRSNDYLSPEDLHSSEKYFPLKIFICDQCWLAQTEDYSSAGELFRKDYAYFSSTSAGWLAHAKTYCDMIRQRLGLSSKSFVIELASNDGYLLKNFVAAGIPCLGIEPTESTAKAAEALGIPVLRAFFEQQLAARLAQEDKKADLIIGNNVYAHVPDINDFTLGIATCLKPGGTVTLEFPHLLSLMEFSQFDTVYHEHYSYLSLYAVQKVFGQADLRVFDVEKLKTHGGSLRVYGCLASDTRPVSKAVSLLLQEEEKQGLRQLATYKDFQARADQVKDDFLTFLLAQKRQGRKVAAYGAAAKGNTLLNYAGIKPDLLPYVCDAAPAKQGKFMPGSHIPILTPAEIQRRKPDVIVILPWNIRDEVVKQLEGAKQWGARFAVAVPRLEVFEL
jgi:SAM-dependent methyltransferase